MKTSTYGLHAHSQAAPYPYRVVAIGDTGWQVHNSNGYRSAVLATSRAAQDHAMAMYAIDPIEQGGYSKDEIEVTP